MIHLGEVQKGKTHPSDGSRPDRIFMRLWNFFFPDEKEVPLFAVVIMAGFLAFLIVFGHGYLTATLRELGDAPGFMHRVNLVFHEAGHLIFGVSGSRFVMIAGGILGQLLVPLILVLAFRFTNKEAFGAAVCLWWFGQSFVDCAPYINDARALDLQLLGGGTGREVEGHDWEYLLTELDLLNKDIYIARGCPQDRSRDHDSSLSVGRPGDFQPCSPLAAPPKRCLILNSVRFPGQMKTVDTVGIPCENMAKMGVT